MTSLLNKVVLITGSTSGIGLEAARQFYKRGATVLLTCRDEIRGRNALESVLTTDPSPSCGERARLYTLDLMSYDSIINFCKEVLSDWKHIDVLVLNAGIMGKAFELSSDGVEAHFATNMFGHYVILNQLYEVLSNGSEPSRVIVVSSGLYSRAEELPSLKKLMGEEHWESYNSRLCYAISKLANCLYTKEIAKRFQNHGGKVQVFAVRPGFIGATNLGRETHWLLRLLGAPFIWLFSQSLSKGVEPILHLSSNDLTELKSGSLYNNDCREEDFNQVVNVANRSILLRMLYDMEELILARSLLPEETIKKNKEKRNWYLK